MMRSGGTSVLYVIFFHFVSLLASAESLEGLTRLQKQASHILKENQSTGSSLEALDYLIGKFSRPSTGGPALWKVDLNSINAPKPRIVVSNPLEDPNSSLIPRWVIRQQLDSVSGTCVPLSPLRLDFSSDPSCSNSEVTVDTSALSGIENENSIPPEAEQIGVIGVFNLSKEDKEELLSNPAFIPEKRSDKIQPLIVRFKKLVLREDSYVLTIDVAGISVDLPIKEGGSILCGFPQEDNPTCLESRPAKLCGCYDHSEAMQAGRGKLKDGTEIELVQAAPGSGFTVWKEKNGNRILKSTGLWTSPDDWQKKLYASGLFGVENTQFSTAEIETFAGRACPANTFQDEANRFDTEGCVYFDSLTSNQALRAAWNHPETVRAAASAWFDQNHQICADRGKRLPTLYEFQTESPPAKLPLEDGQPAFSSLSGIHLRRDAIWTATSALHSTTRTTTESYTYRCGTGRWFNRKCTGQRQVVISDSVEDHFWRFSHLGLNHASFSTPSQVMCVLPSNPQTRNICIANASGGTTTEISQNLFSRFRIHTFSNVGTDQFRVIDNCPMEVLVVAGGGGAGSGRAAGGGGGGGVVHRPNFNFPSMGQYPIKVGAGGGARTQGQNSSISNLLIAIGGGRGGNGEGWANKEGGSGGSGGGGGFKGGWGAGAGTAGQGHNGGNNRWGNWIAGGGGGGAGGGGHGGHGNNRGSGGPGGWGRAFNMRGTTEYFGGGGGGRGQHDASSGGAGGGGSGGREASGTHGTPQTGGGGGGSDGSGGSGVVIIKYQIQ